MSEYGGETVDATATAFRIVETLAALDGARLTEVVTEVDLPKSTCYKHLQTLCSLDYVYRDGYEYRVTPRFVGIGNTVASNWQVPEFRAEIDRLAEISQEVAGVYVQVGDLGTDVYQTVGESAEGDVGEFANSAYLHCSAPGKAILSELDESRAKALLEDHGTPSYTDHTIVDDDELFEELDRIRERGVAFEREEQDDARRSLAMTVPDDVTDRDVAVYVAGPADRLTGKRFEQDYPGMLADTVNQIERSYAGEQFS